MRNIYLWQYTYLRLFFSAHRFTFPLKRKYTARQICFGLHDLHAARIYTRTYT